MEFSHMKQKVEERVLEVLCKLERLYGVQVEFPRITYDIRGGSCFGRAWRGKPRIALNRTVMEAHFEDFVKKTVGHEVCHLVCFKKFPMAKPHGREWKRMMVDIGLAPERCGNYEVAKQIKVSRKPYVYKCSCDTHYVGGLVQKKIFSGLKYRCRKCGEHIVYSHTER